MPRSKTHPMWELIKKRRGLYYNRVDDLVRVRTIMSTPVASTEGIVHLDSLLHYAMLQDLREEFNGRHWPGFPKHFVVNHIPLPIKHHHFGDRNKSLFFGSSSCVMRGGEDIIRWQKRWSAQNDSVVEFKGRKSDTVTTKNGHFRSYSMPLVIHSQNELEFWARGWLLEIRRLLGWITHVGKKNSQGYGRISDISVSQTDQDWSNERDGKPTRPIPVEYWSGDPAPSMYYGYKPPYYESKNQTICAMPQQKSPAKTGLI